MNIYIDEAGRGPLAGPVRVGAVVPLTRFDTSAFADSKSLSIKKREACYKMILMLESQGKILLSSSYSRASTIDRLGIIPAQRIAIKRTVKHIEDTGKNVKRKYLESNNKNIGESKNHMVEVINSNTCLVIDGNHTFGLDTWWEVQTVIKGDQKVPFISMASIIAKVERDRFMTRQSKKFPLYGFAQHKGYGTVRHRDVISRHGLCSIHRKSFCGRFLEEH